MSVQCETVQKGVQCCYVGGHTGDCYYSRLDETDRIRWKAAADERDAMRAEIARLDRVLEVCEHKLGYLLRHYPGDKQTKSTIERIRELRKVGR